MKIREVNIFPLKIILRPGTTFFKAFLKDFLLFSTEPLEIKIEKRMEKLGKSLRRTKRPLFKRGRKEEQKCGKEEK